MTNKTKVPADLGLKIGNKKEAFLTRLLKGIEEETEAAEMTLFFNKELKKTVKQLIKAEKENFK